MAVVGPIVVRVTLRQLIVPFVILTGVVVCYGMVSAVDAIVRGIFGAVIALFRRVPFVGSLTESGLHKAEQVITHSLGEVAAALEEKMGAYWHQLAQLVTSVGEAIADLSRVLYQATSTFLTHAYSALFWAAVHRVERALHAARALVAGHTTVIYRTLPAKVGAVAHTLTGAVGALAGELGHVIEWDLPRLRARDRALADRLEKLWRWSRAHAKTVGEVVGLGAVAVALARLGAGWIRCSNVGKTGRALCRTDASLLEDLLLGTVAIFGAVSVVEFARELEAVEDEAVAIMGRLVREWPS